MLFFNNLYIKSEVIVLLSCYLSEEKIMDHSNFLLYFFHLDRTVHIG